MTTDLGAVIETAQQRSSRQSGAIAVYRTKSENRTPYGGDQYCHGFYQIASDRDLEVVCVFINGECHATETAAIDLITKKKPQAGEKFPDAYIPFKLEPSAPKQSGYEVETDLDPGKVSISRFAANGNRILKMTVECQDPEGEANWIVSSLNDITRAEGHQTAEPIPLTVEEQLREALKALAAEYADLQASERDAEASEVSEAYRRAIVLLD